VGRIPLVGVRKHQEDDRMEEKVRAALADVRPNLQADGGDVEFVDVTKEGIVKVRLSGACGSCPMAQITLKMGIEKYLKEKVPEVVEVVAV
jgi:Fe-S cluster biogenesis protein NfuA